MKVKVWNENVHEFKQEFRGEKWTIPAKGFVEMEDDYAHNFLCSYSPIEVDADGAQKPQSFKRLRIEGHGNAFSHDPLTCQACNYKAVSKKDLLTHTNERLNDGKHVKLEEAGSVNPDEIIEGLSPEVLEKLAARLAGLTRKPGRPRKEAEADV
jgi:hypothetical protein